LDKDTHYVADEAYRKTKARMGEDFSHKFRTE